MRRAPISTVVREWARIGATSFGGPPAQVALLRELCVERRGWIGAREFEDANAAAPLLPRPGGAQLAVYFAARGGGGGGGGPRGPPVLPPGPPVLAAVSAGARP